MDDRLTGDGTPASQEELIESLRKSGPQVASSDVSEQSTEPSRDDMFDAIRQKVLLPPEEERQALRQAHRTELTVVPLLSENKDGMVPAVIVRPLNRSEWRSAQEWAVKVSEQPGGKKSPEELFQEKIVEAAVVWPKRTRIEFEAERAGFVPTIYGMVEKISWFFEPNILMNATFTL